MVKYKISEDKYGNKYLNIKDGIVFKNLVYKSKIANGEISFIMYENELHLATKNKSILTDDLIEIGL